MKPRSPTIHQWLPLVLLAATFVATMSLRLNLPAMAPEGQFNSQLPDRLLAVPLAVWRTLTGLLIAGALTVTIWPGTSRGEPLPRWGPTLTAAHLFPVVMGLLALPRQGLAALLLALGLAAGRGRVTSRVLLALALLLSLPLALLLPGLVPRRGEARGGTTWGWHCAALLVLPLTLRILVGLDLATLESLLFGLRTGALGSLASLWEGLNEGLVTMGDGLQFLALSWAQPSALVAGLLESDTAWFNPPLALYGAALLLLPLLILVPALWRQHEIPQQERQSLLLLAGLVGAGALPWFDGETVVLSLVALPVVTLHLARVTSRSPHWKAFFWLSLGAVLAETTWGLLLLWGGQR